MEYRPHLINRGETTQDLGFIFAMAIKSIASEAELTIDEAKEQLRRYLAKP